jgi:hypothetical protein
VNENTGAAEIWWLGEVAREKNEEKDNAEKDNAETLRPRGEEDPDPDVRLTNTPHITRYVSYLSRIS